MSEIKKASIILSIALTVLFSVYTAIPAHSETGSNNTDDNYTRTWERASVASSGYWKSYVSDTKHILTSPKRWNSKDWQKALFICAFTGGLTAVDDDIAKEVQENRSTSFDNFTVSLKPLGDGIYTVPAFSLLYLYGYFGDNLKARRASLTAVESLVLGGLFTNIIQRLSTRERPKNGKKWGGPQINTTDLAFPSGHATAGFAVATVLAHEYGHIFGVRPLLYCAAAIASFERVNDNKHRTSDVFLGSAIGYFTAKTLVKLHKGGSDKEFTIIPGTNVNGTALLTVQYGW